MFAMHGSIYLFLKTEGELQQRVRGWMWRTYWAFVIMFVIVSIYAIAFVPNATDNFKHYPWCWGVVILNLLAIANIPRGFYHGREGQAFLSSCCSIAAFVFLFGVALYPNLLVSTIDPAYNLNIVNSASSPLTLKIMAIIAVLGMPFVLTYTGIIYWTFRGKVEIGKFSY